MWCTSAGMVDRFRVFSLFFVVIRVPQMNKKKEIRKQITWIVVQSGGSVPNRPTPILRDACDAKEFESRDNSPAARFACSTL
jgi:hypothetical protein